MSPQAGSCARVPQGSVTCTPAHADPGRGQRTPRCRLHAGPTQHHPVLGPWAQALPARHEGALPEQDCALPAGASLCRRDRLPSSARRRQAACGREPSAGTRPGLDRSVWGSGVTPQRPFHVGRPGRRRACGVHGDSKTLPAHGAPPRCPSGAMSTPSASAQLSKEESPKRCPGAAAWR